MACYLIIIAKGTAIYVDDKSAVVFSQTQNIPSQICERGVLRSLCVVCVLLCFFQNRR